MNHVYPSRQATSWEQLQTALWVVKRFSLFILLLSTLSARAQQPANNDCAGAIALVSGTSCTTTAGTVAGATQSQVASTCNGATSTNALDVWYSFVASGTVHTVQLTSVFDGVLAVFNGACGSLANRTCSDRGGVGATESVSLTGLTVNTRYYIRVYPYTDGSSPAPTTANSTFTICVTGTVAPTCTAPTDLVVSNITASSASVGFTANAVGTSYTVTTSPATTTQTVTASPVSLPGLTAGTTYTVNITTACTNGVTSPAAAATFTTATSPTLTALTPPAELPGLPVMLTGTGFTSGSTVTFGGVAAAGVTYNSPTSLTAVVPAGAPVGNSPVVVTTADGSSANQAFTVLEVYNGGNVNTCSAAVPPTASVNDGQWHYLLGTAGQVVLAYNYTGSSLGTFTAEVLRADPGVAVRQDGANHYYLDRNFHLTASAGPFANRTVQLRLYGLNTELTRLQAADATATLSALRTTQYSGANEDCQLGNNSPTGERRTLPLTVSTPGSGVTWFVAQATVPDHFSEFYLTSSSTPLPVHLTTFTATADGPAAVRLVWATASEQNSAHFDVERSYDGSVFAAIGTVAASGSSHAAHTYVLRDSQLLPHAQILYYRLRQVDSDGTATYSPVRSVALNSFPHPALFPNPATGSTTLTGITPGQLVQVVDALGRQVAAATADATGAAILVLPPGLTSGLYVVRAGPTALRLTVE